MFSLAVIAPSCSSRFVLISTLGSTLNRYRRCCSWIIIRRALVLHLALLFIALFIAESIIGFIAGHLTILLAYSTESISQRLFSTIISLFCWQAPTLTLPTSS